MCEWESEWMFTRHPMRTSASGEKPARVIGSFRAVVYALFKRKHPPRIHLAGEVSHKTNRKTAFNDATTTSHC